MFVIFEEACYNSSPFSLNNAEDVTKDDPCHLLFVGVASNNEEIADIITVRAGLTIKSLLKVYRTIIHDKRFINEVLEKNSHKFIVNIRNIIKDLNKNYPGWEKDDYIPPIKFNPIFEGKFPAVITVRSAAYSVDFHIDYDVNEAADFLDM